MARMLDLVRQNSSRRCRVIIPSYDADQDGQYHTRNFSRSLDSITDQEGRGNKGSERDVSVTYFPQRTEEYGTYYTSAL